MSIINALHVALVGPGMIAIGELNRQGHPLPVWMAVALIILGIVVMLYHGYRYHQKTSGEGFKQNLTGGYWGGVYGPNEALYVTGANKKGCNPMSDGDLRTQVY